MFSKRCLLYKDVLCCYKERIHVFKPLRRIFPRNKKASEKYRAVQQDRIDNLRDEEREEFNMKLEKTKELSRDTNRRRRALEQRRKNYEAEEEKKRREILAQRKKEIQEVTEKFQRANIVKSKRKVNNNNHQNHTKPNERAKQDSFGSGSARQHINTEVNNGQQYYPSVEEVLAMLHADRANVIDRLLSAETDGRSQARDPSPDQSRDLLTGSSPQDQSPVSYYSNKGVSRGSAVRIETSEQHIVEQEKLRSEVVGRNQPKLAFADETKDVTEGVLPTTIRRDSPSGSLSSLDSLDEVPDKVLDPVGAEPAAEVTEGILRNGTKPRQVHRVTFNERVTFNDGFVGILKEKLEFDVSQEQSGMEKQKSYFEIPTEENGIGQLGNETQGMQPLCYSDVKANEAMPKCSQDNAMSGYPNSVNSTPSTLGSGFTSQAYNYPFVTGTDITTGPMSSHLRAANTNGTMSKSSQDIALLSHAALVKSTPSTPGSGSTTTNITPGAMSSHLRANSVARNGFPDEQDGDSAMVHGKTSFSSINASMLKDSLEVNHESMDSTVEPRTQRRIPTAMNHARGTSHAEVAPDVPLIPVTKKDFLSKALLRTSDNTVTPSANAGMSSATTGMSSANAGMSSANTVTPSANGFYSRNDNSKQSSMYGYNRTNVPYYGNDSAGNFVPNAKHESERNEHDVRGFRGTQGNNGIPGSDAKIAPKLRTVARTTNNEALLNRQNGTTQQNNRHLAYNGSPRKTVQAVHEDTQYTASRKRNSSDDLLKTVQEDLQRITMLPAQQSVSRAQSSTTAHGRVPSVNVEGRRKPVVPDGHGRKLTQKNGNGLNAKSKDEKKSNSTAKRLHRPAVETGSGMRKQSTKVKNIQYSSNQNNAQEYQTTNPSLNRVHDHSPDHDATRRSPWTADENPDAESRPVEPRGAHARQDRKNGAGLVMLDKTPTDEEINTLWETVRTCLKHEQTQKASSDSIVNSVRHSRSTNGPLVGNHYLIDTNQWDARPVRPVPTNAFGLNSTPASEFRQGTSNGYVSFRRQNSLDSFERKSSLPLQRKGSLLEYRSHRAERRFTTRTQEPSRAPLNQKYFQALRGPTTSARGPKKSNSVKTEEANRPQLSNAEFQAVMQASSDLQTRNGETQKRPHQALHQPIIMNYRKEHSALSLEEKRLLESLDRLNERLKVQEAVTGKIPKGQGNLNTPGNNTSMGNSTKYATQRSPNNSRFSNQARQKGLATSPSFLNRR